MSPRRVVFVLSDDLPRDQEIITWLDSVIADKSINVSEIIRRLLHQYITGGGDDTAERIIEHLDATFAQLRQQIMTMPRSAGGIPMSEPSDHPEAIEDRLGQMDD